MPPLALFSPRLALFFTLYFQRGRAGVSWRKSSTSETQCIPALAATRNWHRLSTGSYKSLPKRAAAILDKTNASDWDGVRQAAHQLKGAGGSYGFAPLTPAAARVEDAIANDEEEGEILAAVVELVDLCLGARAGVAAG